MKQWPHAPVHLIHETGTYMVTAGTYKKQHFFDASDKIRGLHDTLISTAADFGWLLQAWAVFSNHYHFVAISPERPENLPVFISKLHSDTAKAVNIMDCAPGRQVWFQYWDSRITYQTSYFTRLKYVHNNPVHHGLTSKAEDYPWCSAAWFARTADDPLLKTVSSMKIDRVKVMDDY